MALSWDDVLGFDAERPTPSQTPANAPRLRMQDVVAADVLLLLRRANETLADASALIDSASTLPSILAARREPPAPTERERSDWYIEPLLTLRQVSQLLGASTRCFAGRLDSAQERASRPRATRTRGSWQEW